MTLEVGDFHLGVRSATPELHEVLRRLFAEQVRDGVTAPANFSVAVNPPSRTDVGERLHVLFFGSTLLLRTRSPRHLVGALVRLLSGIASPVPDELLAIGAVAVVAGDRAVLLPPLVRSRRHRYEPHLRRASVAMLEDLVVGVDHRDGHLVVAPPVVGVQQRALAELERLAPEPRRRAPVATVGRYRIERWFLPGLEPGIKPRTAERLLHAMPYLHSVPRLGAQATLERAAALVVDVPVEGLPPGSERDQSRLLLAALGR